MLEINQAAITNSILLIEGLSGSGKTYLASSYLEHANYSKVYWHEGVSQELLENLLVGLDALLEFSSQNVLSQCKELLHYLKENNRCLVIDDFHNVDQESFMPLLKAASSSGKPTHVILLSQIKLIPLGMEGVISEIECKGFSESDVSKIIKSRKGRPLSNKTIKDLVLKTEGLPLAISIFCTLVKGFNRDPESLLAGKMLMSQRLSMWFSNVISSLKEEELVFAKWLSVCSEPFNDGLVRFLSSKVGIDDWSLKLATLQSVFLVQSYSPYRYKIHKLIGDFLSKEILDQEFVYINREIGIYYSKRLLKKGDLDKEDLTWLDRTCKYFQKANDHSMAEKILYTSAHAIKIHGLYNVFISLAKYEVARGSSTNSWLNYHYAHCCFIVGEYSSALSAIEPLFHCATSTNPNKRIKITRLYAEILSETGKLKEATVLLTEELEELRGSLKDRVLAHTESVISGFFTRSKEYVKAETICNNLLRNASSINDNRGGAIALCRIGVIHFEKKEFKKAVPVFQDAVALFQLSGDKRGLAWGLLYLAFSQAELNKTNTSIKNAHRALEIKKNINECSGIYLKELLYYKKYNFPVTLRRKFNSEVNRVKSKLGTWQRYC